MGKRVSIKESVASSIAEIAWHIESNGMVATANKFADDDYDHFIKLGDSRRTYAVCRDPERAAQGFRCSVYKKKYSIVFLETAEELIICEFIPSKLVRW